MLIGNATKLKLLKVKLLKQRRLGELSDHRLLRLLTQNNIEGCCVCRNWQQLASSLPSRETKEN